MLKAETHGENLVLALTVVISEPGSTHNVLTCWLCGPGWQPNCCELQLFHLINNLGYRLH